jgi:hypothetical protein
MDEGTHSFLLPYLVANYPYPDFHMASWYGLQNEHPSCSIGLQPLEPKVHVYDCEMDHDTLPDHGTQKLFAFLMCFGPSHFHSPITVWTRLLSLHT